MPRARSTSNRTRRDRQAARTRGKANRPNERPSGGPKRTARSQPTGLGRWLSRLGGRGQSPHVADTTRAEPTATTRRRRIRHGVLISLAVIVTLLAGGAWWVYTSLHTLPDYWQANQRFVENYNDDQLNRMGAAVRDRLVRDVTSSIERNASPNGHTQTRDIRLKLAHINAWLASRLDAWLANQELTRPAPIGRVMLTSEDGKPVIAFAYHGGLTGAPAPDASGGRRDGSPLIISLVLAPSIDDQGRARLPLHAVRIGEMPVPRDQALEQLQQHLASRAEANGPSQLLSLLRGKPFEPRWRLDARAARVVGIEVDEQTIQLTIRHEPAESLAKPHPNGR